MGVTELWTVCVCVCVYQKFDPCFFCACAWPWLVPINTTCYTKKIQKKKSVATDPLTDDLEDITLEQPSSSLSLMTMVSPSVWWFTWPLAAPFEYGDCTSKIRHCCLWGGDGKHLKNIVKYNIACSDSMTCSFHVPSVFLGKSILRIFIKLISLKEIQGAAQLNTVNEISLHKSLKISPTSQISQSTTIPWREHSIIQIKVLLIRTEGFALRQRIPICLSHKCLLKGWRGLPASRSSALPKHTLSPASMVFKSKGLRGVLMILDKILAY